MNNYPPGAVYDPDALYNEPLPEPYEVLVSVTLSKQFTVEVIKREDREIDENDIRLSHFLPDEILKVIARQNDDDKRIIKCMKEDAADWEVDNLVVMET